MKKKIKDLLFLLLVLFLAVTYFIPALLEQKQKEWKEQGMGSIFEALDPDTNEQSQSESTHDEP